MENESNIQVTWPTSYCTTGLLVGNNGSFKSKMEVHGLIRAWRFSDR